MTRFEKDKQETVARLKKIVEEADVLGFWKFIMNLYSSPDEILDILENGGQDACFLTCTKCKEIFGECNDSREWKDALGECQERFKRYYQEEN